MELGFLVDMDLNFNGQEKKNSRKRVAHFFKNGTALLFVKQNNILSAAFVIMLMVAVSRVLGLFRDRLLAGAPNFDLTLLGVYFAAFRIPDLLFQLLVFGALSVAFIPVFTEFLHKYGPEEAWKFSSSLVNITFLVFGVFSIVVFIFARPLSILIAPGLIKENVRHLDLMVNLTRILLFAQMFFVISSFLTGILQSFQRFLIPALAAVFYNLGIIFGIVVLAPRFGIYGPALGAVFGAFLHLLVQVPIAYSLGFKYKLIFDFRHPGVREVGKMMLPRTLSLAGDQLSLTINTILASLISLKSITIFSFAQHLQVVPLGLFGATIAQAALPALSEEHAKNNMEDFKSTLLTSLHQILFLVIPASAVLIALRIPIVRLVFGASQFDWEATVFTGKTVALLSVGLFAQAASALLIRGFYALKDTVTPLKISFYSVILNTVLSVIFLKLFNQIWWLGLSASISSIFDLLLLVYVLDKKVGSFNRKALIAPAVKICFSGFIMAVTLWGFMKILDKVVFDTTRTINLIFLTGTVGILGIGFYLVLTWVLKVKEVTVFWEFFRRLTNWKSVISQSEEVIDGTGSNP